MYGFVLNVLLKGIRIKHDLKQCPFLGFFNQTIPRGKSQIACTYTSRFIINNAVGSIQKVYSINRAFQKNLMIKPNSLNRNVKLFLQSYYFELIAPLDIVPFSFYKVF